ncbi:hypothetical protein QR680_006982 [Steinernema hermaphroditum]|uniref:DZF domain-containing protein n=1 Tax=Steinernema hermaphroditum TaxID=289476 RepID=A0AA39HYP6_9BILA|nr:hypothetical protein QR680_006982 [Steinernema hermaphroditum]
MATNGNANVFYRPVPFDSVSCGPSAFPVISEVDDFALSKLLVDRGAKLIPSEVDKRPLNCAIELVTGVLNKLREGDAEMSDINVVGPFAKGTSLAIERSVDLVVTLKSLPTQDSMSTRGEKFCEVMKMNPACQFLIFEKQDNGFEVRDPTVNVSLRVMFTVPINLFREHKADVHVDKAILMEASKALRRTGWFISRSKRSALENFVRILLDVKRRFAGLQALQDWHLELYAYHSLSGMTANGQPISLAQAFKRFFQLFSAGALLPDAPTLADPVLTGPGSTKENLTCCYTLEQLDEICQAAQTICRLIMMGSFYEVLGVTPLAEGDARLFSQKAYNPEDDDSAKQ